MAELFKRNRRSTGNCASCRFYRAKVRHPADNESSEPYCEIDDTANLQAHVRELEWWVCRNWDLPDDPKAASVYQSLLAGFAYDTVGIGR